MLGSVSGADVVISHHANEHSRQGVINSKISRDGAFLVVTLLGLEARKHVVLYRSRVRTADEDLQAHFAVTAATTWCIKRLVIAQTALFNGDVSSCCEGLVHTFAVLG
jgi:hypothetical protein